MENPLVKGYVALDNAIMYGVNKAVHGWNWTTGDTKAGLANKLLTIAPVLESTGGFIDSIPEGIFSAFIFLINSHLFQQQNITHEESEERAINSGLIDPNIFRYNSINSLAGYVWSTFSGANIIDVYSEKNKNPESSIFFGAGTALRALSHFVMRSDFLPPGKNCFQRGREKLESLVRDYKNKPALAPVLELERVR